MQLYVMQLVCLAMYEVHIVVEDGKVESSTSLLPQPSCCTQKMIDKFRNPLLVP